ncbi:ABC transporter permease [Solibacillus merdavium]|uniref:ABC transporter permease n=1 Tax=Solibacillus merdavium TaxID=2762218 RepID=A0ABR8XNL4_9BACL|nr:ABC transporter permease [Solibacillus merdavium]MBD8033489.1 ABC transporter permease [Solibacillus merdavium]
MYRKLALRNVRRQIGNYLIYFITVALTISLIFAMNNLIFNDQLQTQAQSIAELALGLVFLSIIICIIIAFVLGYANAFMLRLRKREFGTYLTVGMKRKHIVKLFLFENSLLGILAMVVGFFVGSLFYQGLMLLMTQLLDIPFEFSMFSLKGVLLTIGMVCSIFLFSSLVSSFYLNRVTIYELIHGEKKVEQGVKHPYVAMLVTGVSFVGIIVSFIFFSRELKNIFLEVDSNPGNLVWLMLLLTVSLVTFHIGLAKSLMYILLGFKHFTQRGTNQFLLRQLSAMLSSNAILLGALSFLIVFAMIAANFSFLYKEIEEANLDKQYPFDIIANINSEQEGSIPLEQAKETIESYVPIDWSKVYNGYSTNERTFHKHTIWQGDKYQDVDMYMKESEVNELLQELGSKPLNLDNQFAIFSDMPGIQGADFSEASFNHKGQTYTLSHVVESMPMFLWSYFVIVVPDEVVEGMEISQTAAAITLEEGPFDAQKLQDALSYTYKIEENNYSVLTSDYRVKEQRRLYAAAFSAIFIVGALYLAVVFILLAMAILALKILSNLRDDEKKYRLLNRLGVNEELQRKTLAKQIFVFFTFPIVVPICLSIPITIILNQFIDLAGYSAMLNFNIVSVSIVVVIGLIYFLYFMVTFGLTKKYVIQRR